MNIINTQLFLDLNRFIWIIANNYICIVNINNNISEHLRTINLFDKK